MKSIALIVWLLSPNGSSDVVARHHLDTMAACETQAAAIEAGYQQQGSRTRHLCHAVVEEYGQVDANGNPITSVAAH